MHFSAQMKHVYHIDLNPNSCHPTLHLQMVTASVLDRSGPENPQNAKVWNLFMFYNLQLLQPPDLLLKCHPIQNAGASIMKYDGNMFSTFLADPSNMSE
jgi:hypothetical protein